MSLKIARLLIVFLVVTTAGCERPPSSEAHYRVMAMLKTSDYEQVLKEVNRRLEKDPKKIVLLEDRLILLLANANPQARAEVLKTQARLDAVGAGRFILLEQAQSRNAQVRQQTAYTLGVLRGAYCLEALKNLAEDKDQEVRAEAVHALAKLNHPDAKKLMMIRLRDGYWKVRAEAAEALAKSKDPTVTKQLFRSVDDSDDYARMQIFDAILDLANASQADLYLDELDSPNIFRKIAAALALAKIHRTEVIPVLISLLKEKNSPERLEVAQCLVQLRADPSIFDSLIKNERNPQVKEVFLQYMQHYTALKNSEGGHFFQ